MRIALAQSNSYLGDFEENRKKALDFIRRAQERSCEIVVFPEAFMFGYHPVDLLERPSIVDAQLKEIKKLVRQMPMNITVIVGAITPTGSQNGKPYYNSALVIKDRKIVKTCAKQLLPSYDVFDESRHIEAGALAKNIVKIKNKRVLVTICEDIWAWPNTHHGKRSPYAENPLKKIKKSAVDLVVNLSASPFTPDKFKSRLTVCQQTVKHFSCPMAYVNMVGGQDEIIFDGGSFALDPKGKVIAKADHFGEDLVVFDCDNYEGHIKAVESNKDEQLRQAIVLGVRDFVRKVGFEKVHLGLSGGIDSALVACLAVDALGPHNVVCLSLPGPFTSELSKSLARRLCENLGVELHELEITSAYDHVNKIFKKAFGAHDFGLVNENFQARLRGLSLMGFSNLRGSLLLNTSNKSELATGYSTLYGDLVGGLSPIGDLLKKQVYSLSKYYNREFELIPQELIDRPPTAELSENQKDSDRLLPYDQLDPIVTRLVEKFSTPRNKEEQSVLNMMMNSEFKRWQAPPILKVSNHAFGRGRRLPIAHRARV